MQIIGRLFGQLQIIVYFCQLKLNIFKEMASYYIVENNQRSGPFSYDQLAARGISSSTEVWTEGMSNWMPAGDVPELQSIINTQSQSYSGSYQSGYDAGGYYPMPPDNKSKAITELIFAIVTSFCCLNVLSIGGIIFGILGIMEAGKVSSFYGMNNYVTALKASNDAAKWVKWGYIINVIGILLGIILIFFYFGLAVLAAALENM